MGPRWT